MAASRSPPAGVLPREAAGREVQDDERRRRRRRSWRGHGSRSGWRGDGQHDDEAALTEFLSSLMDYTPTIPDELVEHYLGRSGFHCPDLRLTRLVAVATQKFLSDIASDSLQYCKARVAAPIKDNKSKQPKDKRLVLTMDDLSKALCEHGVNLKHPEYFADSPSAGMAPSTREE
ncbi:transcription initiation factor TFIID subunit 10-like isoform X2 [Miscanthus floridulus]|uniref:transcription initiation factor TFIID subunit 10-like isoform X2 n=1 Tax=Miscanthus floridulus TaxID=154761 RepID=UPI003459F6FB